MFDVHTTPAPAYSVTVDGERFRFEAVNAALRERALATYLVHTGLTPSDCFPAPLADAIESRFKTVIRTRKACSFPSTVLFPTETQAWTTMLFPILGEGEEIVSIVGLCLDDQHGLLATAQAEAKSDQAIAAIDGGFWIYDIATKAFEVSPPLAELLAGPGRTTLNFDEFKSFVHADDLNAAMLTLEDRSCVDYRVLTYDGRARWLRSNRRLVRDAAKTPMRIVGLVIDVTDEKTAMQALESEASRDGLTGLMNRRAFTKVARQRLRARPSNRGEIGLVMIDIDDFKAVNDRHGHLCGDDLLCHVARRISRATRGTDYVARIGGDEFVIMTDSAVSMQAIEARLERSFAKTMTIGSTSIVVSISFGSTQAIADDKTIESLMARADAALYAQKAKRRQGALRS